MIQGLAITLGALLAYQYSVSQGYNEAQTRTMTFTVLIAANIFLTLVNRSFYYSILTTLKYKNQMVKWMIALTLFIMALLLYVKPLTSFFEFEQLSINQLGVASLIGFLSVIWYEGVKWGKRRGRNT